MPGWELTWEGQWRGACGGLLLGLHPLPQDLGRDWCKKAELTFSFFHCYCADVQAVHSHKGFGSGGEQW